MDLSPDYVEAVSLGLYAAGDEKLRFMPNIMDTAAFSGIKCSSRQI